VTVIGLQTTLPQIITAIGGLGTASFGFVEAIKALFTGINRIGFPRIKTAVTALTPTPAAGPANALSQQKILDTLDANWVNGTDLASQKAIAKTLIKLNLAPGNAAALASATGVDPATLTAIAENIATGTALTPAQSDVFGRFDLIVTALLDEVYQRSDQAYRTWIRFWAMIVSVVLALAAAFILRGMQPAPLEIGEAILVGLLATPLAPIAKDLSSALAAAVNAMQLVRKAGRS
jgi:hypothetical protein